MRLICSIMRFSMFLVLLSITAFLCGCSSTQDDGVAASEPGLEDFRNALVSYIDSHPGFFKGRQDSKGLKDKQFVKLEGIPGESVSYSLEEFIICPDKMTFKAEYDPNGPESYVYKGLFVRNIAGMVSVGGIRLAKFRVRLQPLPAKTPPPPLPPDKTPAKPVKK